MQDHKQYNDHELTSTRRDNTCVMHRAAGGTFEGKYKRDMRRTTVHDGSSQAWGLNDKSAARMGYVTALDNRLRA